MTESSENAARPVSIVTVSYDTFFFVRLLVEKVRELIGPRLYEVIVVDRGSCDGTRELLEAQPDVRLLTAKSNCRGHGHGARHLTEALANHARCLGEIQNSLAQESFSFGDLRKYPRGIEPRIEDRLGLSFR